MKNFMVAVTVAALSLAGCIDKQPESKVPADRNTASLSTPERDVASTGVEATSSVVVSPVAINGPTVGKVATRPRFAEILPSENRVIEGKGLSVSKVTGIIKTDQFAKFVAQLSVESAIDPLAQDVTASERARWENQLAGEAPLRDFACGLSVCAGRIELGSNTALYDRISDEFLKNGSQGGSLLDYRVDLGNGNFEQRFVISHDPSVGGITFGGGLPVNTGASQ